MSIAKEIIWKTKGFPKKVDKDSNLVNGGFKYSEPVLVLWKFKGDDKLRLAFATYWYESRTWNVQSAHGDTEVVGWAYIDPPKKFGYKFNGR